MIANLTPSEESTLRVRLQAQYPATIGGRQIGDGARKCTIVASWSHVDGPIDGPGACGVTVQAHGHCDSERNVSLPDAIAEAVAAAADPGLACKLGLIGSREVSLEFDQDEWAEI